MTHIYRKLNKYITKLGIAYSLFKKKTVKNYELLKAYKNDIEKCDLSLEINKLSGVLSNYRYPLTSYHYFIYIFSFV